MNIKKVQTCRAEPFNSVKSPLWQVGIRHTKNLTVKVRLHVTCAREKQLCVLKFLEILKPLLDVETFSWNLCATALRNLFQQALHRVTWLVSWNFLNFCCETSFTESRTAFYFCNGRNDCSQVTKTRVSPCNTILWNLFATPLHTSFS